MPSEARSFGVLDLNTLVKNSGLAYLSTVALILLGSLIKILLARFLSPYELGLFLTAQILMALLATLGQLSVPDALVRFVGYRVGAGSTNPGDLVLTARQRRGGHLSNSFCGCNRARYLPPTTLD